MIPPKFRLSTSATHCLKAGLRPLARAGHIEKVDSLITPESFNLGRDFGWDTLEYFSIDRIRPEKVTTIEVGARSSLFNTFYVDLTYYRNEYQHFLGYVIGIDSEIDLNSPPPVIPKNTRVYRYSANSKTKVE